MPPNFEEVDDQPLRGWCILLAEDEERLRTIVAMMVEELGADVVTVTDGLSAIEEYERNRDTYDLVFLDMRMKGLNGDTTFLRLLEIDPYVKVVLSSGVIPDDDFLQILQQHGGGFIEKPFNINKLGTVLSAVIRGEPTQPPG